MLSHSIRILDLDSSLIRQEGLLKGYRNQIIDLKDIGPAARMWMPGGIRERIKETISSSDKSAVTFLGSGDFHHLSSILIGEFQQPIGVIVFDLHPDWDILPPKAACGSWVSSVLKSDNIRKLLLIGTSSEDISGFWAHTADLRSLKDDRVEIYPYAHRPTRIFFRRVPENISLKVQRGRLSQVIYWKGLKGQDPGEFLAQAIGRIGVKDVYISLDKDCLQHKFALTNWEEGKMPLDALLSMLKIIRERLNIVGMDITGEYSPVIVKGAFKRALSFLDHPKNNIAAGLPEAYVSALNTQTNLKILEALGLQAG